MLTTYSNHFRAYPAYTSGKAAAMACYCHDELLPNPALCMNWGTGELGITCVPPRHPLSTQLKQGFLYSVVVALAIAFIGHYSYFPCAPRRSCVFSCIGCASESAYVGDYSSIPCDPLRSLYSFILCVLNAISSKPPECTIIFIVSL